MYNQLSVVTADFQELLDIPNHVVMPIAGSKPQMTHNFLDGRMAVVTLDSGSRFDVEIQFTYLTDAQKSTLLDFYHSTTKANGGENTFYWLNPVDDYAYTARFLTPLRNVIKSGSINSAPTIGMRISGYYGQFEQLYDSGGGAMQDSAGTNLYVRK